MRPIQILKLRPIWPSYILCLPKDRRLIRRLVISPFPIEIHPSQWCTGAGSFEAEGGRVVRVRVGVEDRVPQTTAVRVVH